MPNGLYSNVTKTNIATYFNMSRNVTDHAPAPVIFNLSRRGDRPFSEIGSPVKWSRRHTTSLPSFLMNISGVLNWNSLGNDSLTAVIHEDFRIALPMLAPRCYGANSRITKTVGGLAS